jgi:hypothetical protein
MSFKNKKTEQFSIEPVPEYCPLSYHWFYTKETSEQKVWIPMSIKDSHKLEAIYLQEKYF